MFGVVLGACFVSVVVVVSGVVCRLFVVVMVFVVDEFVVLSLE